MGALYTVYISISWTALITATTHKSTEHCQSTRHCARSLHTHYVKFSQNSAWYKSIKSRLHFPDILNEETQSKVVVQGHRASERQPGCKAHALSTYTTLPNNLRILDMLGTLS